MECNLLEFYHSMVIVQSFWVLTSGKLCMLLYISVILGAYSGSGIVFLWLERSYKVLDALQLSYYDTSRWNELRSSPTAPFFGRSTGWSGGEAFGRCKEQYSMVRECCSTCLSNYGSRMRHRYVMALPPDPRKL